MKKREKSIWIFAGIHIFCSFLYEVYMWRRRWSFFDKNAYSVRWGELEPWVERGVLFLFSKIAGIILIVLIWKIILYMIGNKKWGLMLFLFVGLCCATVMYPFNYMLEEDNLILYAESIEYYPDYWQSFYMGVIYNACLTVIPHGFSILLIQICFFYGGIWYLSQKMGEKWGKRYGIIPYFLILLPESYIVANNPYRNTIYVIFCIWYLVLLFFVWIPQREPSLKGWLIFLLYSAFLIVLRSEGIVFIFTVCAVCFFVWKVGIKQRIKRMLIFCIILLVMMLPQKAGTYIYYGKDYEIVNYMDVLQEILNTKDHNLKYKGAEKDLEILENLVPKEMLQAGGLMGYRVYNFATKGTTNQSLLKIDEQRELLKAVQRIVFHNMDIFVRNRIICFGEANGMLTKSYNNQQELQNSEQYVALLNDSLEKYNKGINCILNDSLSQWWFSDSLHIKIYQAINEVYAKYWNLLYRTGMLWMGRCVALIMLISMDLFLIKKRGVRQEVAVHFTTLALMGLWGAVFLFSPEGRMEYYLPAYYSTWIWAFHMAADNFRLA